MRLLAEQFSLNRDRPPDPHSSSQYFYWVCPVLLWLHPESWLLLQSPQQSSPQRRLPPSRVALALTNVTEWFVL